MTIPRDVTQPGYKLQSKHSIEEFKKIWGTFDSDMFGFKLSTWEQKRQEYCYAGAWSGLLNIGNGQLTACYGSKIIQNIFDDLTKPINFVAVGKGCRLEHCYNGHSLLALGVIPEINWCRYSSERDRINMNDGTHWLTDEMRDFLSGRLEESNAQFTNKEKWINSIDSMKIKSSYYFDKIQRKLTK